MTVDMVDALWLALHPYTSFLRHEPVGPTSWPRSGALPIGCPWAWSKPWVERSHFSLHLYLSSDASAIRQVALVHGLSAGHVGDGARGRACVIRCH